MCLWFKDTIKHRDAWVVMCFKGRRSCDDVGFLFTTTAETLFKCWRLIIVLWTTYSTLDQKIFVSELTCLRKPCEAQVRHPAPSVKDFSALKPSFHILESTETRVVFSLPENSFKNSFSLRPEIKSLWVLVRFNFILIKFSYILVDKNTFIFFVFQFQSKSKKTTNISV